VKSKRVGVVGVGHLGRYHAQNYASLPGVELVGVTDVDKERAKAVAAEYGCRTFESQEQLLEEVEAVSVVVPTDRHHEVGMEVLERGIHCLMEKPIATNLEEADDLIRKAEEKGVVLQVGHIERFNPAFRALAGTELEPRFIESHRLSPYSPRGTEVAVVLDLMIHDIDAILTLVKSPVESIAASGIAVVSETADIANVRLRFENGCVANMTASRISQKKMRKMRLFQKDTYISIDFLDKNTELLRLVKEESSEGTVLGEIGVGDRLRKVVLHQPEIPKGQSLETELEAFVKTLRGETVPFVSGQDARAALAVAMQILQDMET
jgi:predicted dehydrogenase